MSNEVKIDGNDTRWIVGMGLRKLADEKTNDAVSAMANGPAEPLPAYDTEALFAGKREILIRHAGADYRMKITKQGKLILNK